MTITSKKKLIVNVLSLGMYNAKILSEALHRLSILNCFFLSYPKISTFIPSERLKNASIFYVLLFIFQKLKIPLFSLLIVSSYDMYVLLTSRYFNFDQVSILHGLSGFSLLTLRSYKRANKLCVIDRAGSHISHQKKLMIKQYSEFGFQYNRSYFILEERMLIEYQEADLIIVPSQYCRQTFIDYGIPSHKLHVLVATANLKPAPNLKKQFNPGTTNYLFVGGVGAQKGLAYMLKAWEYLLDDQSFNIQGSNLTIISTDVPKSLRKLLDLPGITYFTKLDQGMLFETYAKSHVLCHPAVDDAFGFVVQEAMHFGLIPIISKNCGATDIIQSNLNGIVIPAFCHVSLAEAMRLLCTSPDFANALSVEAKKTITRFLSSDYYSSGLFNLYNKALSAHHQKTSDESSNLHY